MPEATMLCIDSSDYMRDGDYFPSRMSSTQEACSLVLGFKLQTNPENTVGFLTMGGKACTVRETLTTDSDRVLASATTIPVGGKLHFSHGLQIAQLALSHRINRRHEARIIAFVGSPLTEPAKELEKLAKRLRKDDIAVDIVCFGVPENVELLDSFVSNVNKNNNSHFVNVPVGSQIVDMALPVLTGTGAPGSGGGNDFSEYGGVDPNTDPDLAMVLRMSLEEERRRVESAAEEERRQAQAASTSQATPAASPTGGDVPADAPQARAAGGGGERELTEEEEFELALKLSMQQQAGGSDDSAAKPKPSDQPSQAFREAVQDPDFLKELEDDADKDDDDVHDAKKK